LMVRIRLICILYHK